jgi:tartrate dehydrogenase/decarboxylase/D-malate dehydrogenase
LGSYRVAVIPGDGIGTEVIAAGCRVLEQLCAGISGLELTFEQFPWGTDYYLETGAMMPDDALATLKSFDAIYFGSAGDPRVPDHVSLWQLRLAICQGLDQYANIRPARLLPGLVSPLRNVRAEDIDWIIVRENSEGEYSGAGGRVHQGLPLEVGMDVSVITREGAERIQRFALGLAQSRPCKKLAFVTKSNAQRHAMVLWDEVFEETSANYPDVATERVLVDAMTERFVNSPESIDTVVATNLHADVLSDLAAALSGSLGVAPTGNLNPERESPSMFEPIHGSAFDIIGRGIANPLGAMWSASLMLDHLGESDAAARLLAAIEAVTGEGTTLTRDLGGQARTDDVTEAVCRALEGQP